MPSDLLKEISKARLNSAKERIAFAKQIQTIGDYKTVANRSYYATFAAMRAVLALDEFDSKKHSGIIAEFRKRYLKTGVLSKDLSPIIDELVELRQGSDYDDFYTVTPDEADHSLTVAEQFVLEIEQYLLARYSEK